QPYRRARGGLCAHRPEPAGSRAGQRHGHPLPQRAVRHPGDEPVPAGGPAAAGLCKGQRGAARAGGRDRGPGGRAADGGRPAPDGGDSAGDGRKRSDARRFCAHGHRVPLRAGAGHTERAFRPPARLGSGHHGAGPASRIYGSRRDRAYPAASPGHLRAGRTGRPGRRAPGHAGASGRGGRHAAARDGRRVLNVPGTATGGLTMLPLFLTAATVQTTAAAQPVPIRLHPENPRYFLFRGQPTVLISSAEHYGAVLNGAFDYVPYLKELHTKGLNLTRTFSGAYREVPGVFNIPNNTLAPTPEDFIAPWPRSSTPGAADGGNKFDLNQWNEAYFRRLKDFCKQAGAQRVIVEVVLFCPFYEDSLWDVSPMNARNNINGIGTMPRNEVYTLQNREMRALHEKLTRKIVEELRDFDNVYYEICNEPYFGGVTLDWQHHIADTITETEKALPHKHLIAQNIANGSAKIENPHPAVSIFNFHYASPPDAVRINWNLNKPIAFDESGFKGTEDAVYRQQAWEFLLAGGSIFDHLDYSFTAAHPDGTAPVVEPTPGGGSATLRRQLKILKDFLT